MIVRVDESSLEQLICALSRRLYRADVAELERVEEQLLRLLKLLDHYRRAHRGAPGALAGAAHLCRSRPND